MKLPSILVVTGSLLVLLSSEVRANPSVQQLLTEAQQSYMRGDLETAKQQFLTVNRIDPKNVTAIGFLRRIAVEAKNNAGTTMEKQLAGVILPKVEFKEATLGSALEYLKQLVARTTEGKTSLSFIVQVPDEQVKTQTVTLSISNVPLTEVLRYLGGLANVRFEYEKYAVVVKPVGAAGVSAANSQSAVSR